MKVSDFKPIPELSTVLKSAGILETIYENGVPTTELPNEFISLMQNGSLKPKTIKMSYAEGFLMLIISVKLLSTGVVNVVKEDLIFDKIGTIFTDNKPVKSGNYEFSLDTNNLGSGGRGISSGYSTKVINLQVKIF